MLESSLGCLGDTLIVMMVTLDIMVRLLLQRVRHVMLTVFGFLIDDRM